MPCLKIQSILLIQAELYFPQSVSAVNQQIKLILIFLIETDLF